MSRDSQRFRVPPNISEMGKAMNVELVNKQEVLNMRISLIKQQILNTRNLSVYKTV